jgi:hypothetical protein
MSATLKSLYEIVLPQKKADKPQVEESKTLTELNNLNKVNKARNQKSVKDLSMIEGSSPKKAGANTVSVTIKNLTRRYERKIRLGVISMSLLSFVFMLQSLFSNSAKVQDSAPKMETVTVAQKVTTSEQLDRWLPFIDQQLAESVEHRQEFIKELIESDPAMLRSMNLFLRAYEPKNTTGAPLISENAEQQTNPLFEVKEKEALKEASGEEKHHFLVNMIKSSEPAMHAAVLKYVQSRVHSENHILEEDHDDLNKIKKPENFELFTKEDWASVKKEMREINEDCHEVLKMAQNLKGDAGKMLQDVADAFLHIQRVRLINPEHGPNSTKVNYWNSHQAKVVRFQKEINLKHNISAKRDLFAKHKTVVKNEWEIFIESVVRTKLSNALRQPELQTTIGDNLKAIKAHPEFPQEAKDILEVVFRKQFMSVGSKLRFMSWSTLENASGETERHGSVVVPLSGSN